jgi:EAL domain-containing protein (putative c-di-GMP-specific phosphodiesterase class I)
LASDSELLRRIETISLKINGFYERAEDAAKKNAALYAARSLLALARSIESAAPVFGIEPWHPIQDRVPLSAPGEMLLRLKDEKGDPLPPYPAIMAFYDNGLAAEIDTILVLAAVNQFVDSAEQQVSVNVSGKCLRDPDFIKTVLPKIEGLRLHKNRKIIFEIHESDAGEAMSQRVLKLCRKIGIAFAIDDVGLSLSDIFRLSEFESIADFVKLDKKSVGTRPGDKGSLDHVMALIHATLPHATIVAEGVKSAEHAATLLKHHSNIHYVQGLYLPDRRTFAKDWAEARKSIAKTGT